MSDPADQKFRGLLESAPDAIVIVDHEARIQIVNRQAEIVFGYTRDEVLGQPIELLMPERFRERHARLRSGYVADPHTRPMGVGLDLYARSKDGSELPVEISLSPMQSETGLLVISVIRDITERKRVEQQLKQQAQDLARSNAELEQFAYVASHDLQEPLRMVASYTQLLQRRYQGKLDADADAFIHFAVDGALRMQELINDLLTYSRVGTRELKLEAADTRAVVDRVLRDLGASIGESGASVDVGPLPVVRGDATQLSQLFQNLVANAIKFHGERPPHVTITAERVSAEWVFHVADNGIGIDPAYVDRIFVLFQRLHTRADYPGTGIGLAICKKIVERHGGRIWVEPRDTGTTFSFILPVSEVDAPT